MVAETEVQERETLTLNNDNKEEREDNPVQFAQANDIPQIVAIFSNAHRKANDGSLPDFNVNDVMKSMTEFVINHAALVKKDNEGFIEGVIVFKFNSPWWNSEERMLTQVFMSIPDEYQSTKVLMQLVDSAVQLGQDFGIDVYFSPIGKYKEKMSKLLERKNFTSFGHEYKFEVV